MWVLEWVDDEGKEFKHYYSSSSLAFYDFDNLVKEGLKVKHPYYI